MGWRAKACLTERELELLVSKQLGEMVGVPQSTTPAKIDINEPKIRARFSFGRPDDRQPK